MIIHKGPGGAHLFAVVGARSYYAKTTTKAYNFLFSTETMMIYAYNGLFIYAFLTTAMK